MDNLVFNTDALIDRIAERTAEIMSSKPEPPQPEVKDLLTRKETADLLNVNLATLWRWTKAKKLTNYGIGGRTYYKHSEVIQSVKVLNKKQPDEK
jgi:hypothetical protein